MEGSKRKAGKISIRGKRELSRDSSTILDGKGRDGTETKEAFWTEGQQLKQRYGRECNVQCVGRTENGFV